MEEDINRCKELIKTEHSEWIGLSNQQAIENVLNRLQENEAVIKEMVKSIHNDNDIEYEVCEHAHELSIECDGYSRETKEHCEKCIENYFRKKVQDERNKV